MAINGLRAITNAQAYVDLRFKVIPQLEGVRREPYLDTAKDRKPTIGIGFNQA